MKINDELTQIMHVEFKSAFTKPYYRIKILAGVKFNPFGPAFAEMYFN